MIAVALLSIPIAVLCQTPGTPSRPVTHHYFSKSVHEHVAEWSYEGPTGPKQWGQLSPEYRLAESGKHQSPIDINSKSATPARLPALKFDYRDERIAALNNGHTIQHEKAPRSFLHLGDKRYSLEQFHVHAPSEHTLDGKRFEMEIHFVHKSEAGDVVVVAVLVRGDEQSTLDLPLYHDLPEKSGEAVSFEGTRNPSDFLPRSRDYFTYMGSFTTPPCTENIQWIVMRQPLGAPPQIIERFVTILKFNSRPIQSLNGRIVRKSRSP